MNEKVPDIRKGRPRKRKHTTREVNLTGVKI